jgi:hypothetical protein
MAKSKSIAQCLPLRSKFWHSSAEAPSPSRFGNQNTPRLRSALAHLAKSKDEALLGSTSGLGEREISLRLSEFNLKYKIKFKEYKEPEYGTVGATSLQFHERPNHSFKRTPDGAA